MKKFLLKLLLAIIILIAGLTLYGYTLYRTETSKIPLSKAVTELQENSNYVKKENISKDYLNAVVAVEDHRFYNHGVLDFIGIARAIFINAKNGELREGGSSITQQVAKNFYFMNDSYKKLNIRRKIAELFISRDLMNNYSKDDILEIYVNEIYFGNNYYGIREASEGYLNKEPKDLNLAEASMLAGIPNAPSVYAPTINKELCKQRQNIVLDSMVKYKYLDKSEAESVDQSFIDENF